MIKLVSVGPIHEQDLFWVFIGTSAPTPGAQAVKGKDRRIRSLV